MSRQYDYQLRNVAAGKCALCSHPRITAWYCERHRIKQNKLQGKRMGWKKQLVCSACNQPGHNIRTCKVNP